MAAAVTLRNVVGEALHAFLIRVVPLHGAFDRHAVPFAQRVEDVRVQHRFVAVHVFDKRAHAAKLEQLFLPLRRSISSIRTPLLRKLSSRMRLAGCRSGIRRCRRFPAGEEVHFGAAVFGVADHFQRFDCNALAEFHAVHVAVAADGEAQPVGQRIHHRYPHAVQTAGYLVGSSGRTCRRRAARS